MSHWEDELRRSLQRKEPPPEFAERVLQRVVPEPRVTASVWQKLAAFSYQPSIRWLAIGAMTGLLLLGGLSRYRHYQQIKAEQEITQARLILGLQITGAKLSRAQKKIQEAWQRQPSAEPSEN